VIYLPDIEVFKDRLNKGEFDKRITVSPIISMKQIGSGVVDLRLGNDFILTKNTRFSNLNLRDPSLRGNIKSYQEKVSIKSNDRIMLHPNQFILGSTLEYITFKDDLSKKFDLIFSKSLEDLVELRYDTPIFKDHIDYIDDKNYSTYYKPLEEENNLQLIVRDYIAGMSDKYFADTYTKIQKN